MRSMLILVGVLSHVFAQYPGYPSYGQTGYGQVPFQNIPTEIIDVPEGHNPGFQPYQKHYQQGYQRNYGGYYPYPYNYGIPQGNYPQYPAYPQPKPYPQPYPTYGNQPAQQQQIKPINQLPKSYFKNPTPEFPNGYWVIPGSQKPAESSNPKVSNPEASNQINSQFPIIITNNNGTVNETIQEFPGYIIRQSSEKHQTSNVNPAKITTSTVEYKPTHTVLTRFIGRDGKPVVKFETENGTIYLDGNDGTTLNINNGKIAINGQDPMEASTINVNTVETTTESDDDVPRDISSWYRSK